MKSLLNPRAAAVFGEMTGANVGSALAIVLNGKVVAAPVIQSRITDTGMIEGVAGSSLLRRRKRGPASALPPV